jgi:hypothetical protein
MNRPQNTINPFSHDSRKRSRDFIQNRIFFIVRENIHSFKKMFLLLLFVVFCILSPTTNTHTHSFFIFFYLSQLIDLMNAEKKENKKVDEKQRRQAYRKK